MEIFKLFESTMADVQPGHINIKDLRRDQLLDNYDAAVKTLETLIRAKESEIAYRNDLIRMLDQSKIIYENKLIKAKQDYQIAKKQAPETLDLTGRMKFDTINDPGSTTPPGPPPPRTISSTDTEDNRQPEPMLVSDTFAPLPQLTANNQVLSQPSPIQQSTMATSASSTTPFRASELDIPLPGDQNHNENRSSLDRRLSEFLKTFPNINQAGMAAPVNFEQPKPAPGYYTPQVPLILPPNISTSIPPPSMASVPPPPSMASVPPPPIGQVPPLMAMMRFPPPPMMPTQQQSPLPPQHHQLHQSPSSHVSPSHQQHRHHNKYSSSSSSYHLSSSRNSRRR